MAVLVLKDPTMSTLTSVNDTIDRADTSVPLRVRMIPYPFIVSGHLKGETGE